MILSDVYAALIKTLCIAVLSSCATSRQTRTAENPLHDIPASAVQKLQLGFFGQRFDDYANPVPTHRIYAQVQTREVIEKAVSLLGSLEDEDVYVKLAGDLIHVLLLDRRGRTLAWVSLNADKKSLVMADSEIPAKANRLIASGDPSALMFVQELLHTYSPDRTIPTDPVLHR